MRVSARSLSATVTAAFFFACGLFLFGLLVFGEGDGMAAYVMVGFFALLGFTFPYFVWAVSSAAVTPSDLRSGWVGARRVPLSAITRFEIVEGKWLFLEAVLDDGSQARLLRYAGTQLNGPEMARRSVEQARDQIEAYIKQYSTS